MWRFTRRTTVLGLPIGPRRTDWDKLSRLAAGLAAFVAGMGITRRLIGSSNSQT